MAAAEAFRGTAVTANRPQNATALFESGRMFGRIMYLLDSYADYADDQAHGKFNPLAAADAPEAVMPEAQHIFRDVNHRLKGHFSELDLVRPDLAHKLLIQQLKKIGQKTLQMEGKAHASCSRQPAKHIPEAPRFVLNPFGASQRPRREIDCSNWPGCCCDCACNCCCECVDVCDCCDCCNCLGLTHQSENHSKNGYRGM